MSYLDWTPSPDSDKVLALRSMLAYLRLAQMSSRMCYSYTRDWWLTQLLRDVESEIAQEEGQRGLT